MRPCWHRAADCPASATGPHTTRASVPDAGADHLPLNHLPLHHNLALDHGTLNHGALDKSMLDDGVLYKCGLEVRRGYECLRVHRGHNLLDHRRLAVGLHHLLLDYRLHNNLLDRHIRGHHGGDHDVLAQKDGMRCLHRRRDNGEQDGNGNELLHGKLLSGKAPVQGH